jgi:hypothetical protein
MPDKSASVLPDWFAGGPWSEDDQSGWLEPRFRAPRAPRAAAVIQRGLAAPSDAGQTPAGIENPRAEPRRTIQISGRGAERHLPPAPRRRDAHVARTHRAPDRIALWAVLLGIVLLLVAATSSHAAVTQSSAAASHPRPAASHPRPAASHPRPAASHLHAGVSDVRELPPHPPTPHAAAIGAALLSRIE